MKKLSIAALVIACLAMIPALFMPIWNIYLDAPQYPEGLTMSIWLNQLTGDVATISGLNHYIGMKAISADMFPEFGYMKSIVIGVIISGLLVAAFRKRWLFMVWFAAFFAIAAVGIYDFYNWEYDYGHNLNPHAAIKIPGMSYQPPLLGCQQLLNFYACSFPAGGGWLIVSAGTIGFLIFVNEVFLGEKKKLL